MFKVIYWFNGASIVKPYNDFMLAVNMADQLRKSYVIAVICI